MGGGQAPGIRRRGILAGALLPLSLPLPPLRGAAGAAGAGGADAVAATAAAAAAAAPAAAAAAQAADNAADRSTAAAGADTGGNRLVLVLLRGGMDGLAALPVPGDPAHAAARGALAQAGAAPLPLAGPYALHPLLPALHSLFHGGELVVVHATGLPDGACRASATPAARSHVDAQHALDAGVGAAAHLGSTGWLGRALGAGCTAAAVGGADPLVLRAGRLPAGAGSAALPAARSSGADGEGSEGGDGNNPVHGAARRLAADTALLLRHGARATVLELGGWDTHVAQAAPGGALADNLRLLDTLLAALRGALLAGGLWRRTAVLVTTEFGRSVAANAAGGTDHGSGGVAFVAGGAVRGGRVVADWPGLSARALGRAHDLRITTDLRAVQRTLLHQHLHVPRALLDSTVLPGTAGLPMVDLLRG